MKFDYCSDIHIDYWVASHLKTQEILIHDFLFRLLPMDRSDVLVIAGDIGHFNAQINTVLKVFRKYYKYVVWVHGNHEMYVNDTKSIRKYRNDFVNRLAEFKPMSDAIGDVYYLDGDVIELDGIRFGGCSMWYDFSYAETFTLTRKTAYDYWRDKPWIDFKNIHSVEFSSPGNGFDPVKYFESQKEKLDSMIGSIDVMISHVGPDASKIIKKYRTLTTSFYYFDGLDYLYNGFPKVWVYGHTHIECEHKIMNTSLLCSPIGYENESSALIKTFNI